MNSDQLYYLIELSHNTSINAASLKLHITPQALSTAIKKLEDELGFTLLNRSSKGVSFTTDGQWLVDEATVFLNKIEQRKQQYQSEQTICHNGLLNIAINYIGISNNILGQLICTLSQREPDLKITLQEKSKEDILTEVSSKAAEFGFIFRTKLNGVYTDVLDPALRFESLYSGDLILNTAVSSELAKFNSITMKKAVQYPLCSYGPQQSTSNSLQHFIMEGFNFPMQFETENNFAIYKEKLTRGIANAFSVFFSIETTPSNYIEGTKIIKIRDDIKIYFGYIQREDSILSDNALFFIQELKKLVQSLQKNAF